jgi:phosphoribosylanthranilate isomerase
MRADKTLTKHQFCMDTLVKICGITSEEDARAVAEAGADAVGLMFYEPSPRFVSRETAKTIVEALPASMVKVGVFVDASPTFVHETIAECGVTVAQFHGDETPEYCSQFPVRVWKAFRVRDEDSLRELPKYWTDAWLLDSYVKGQPGGTGERFNWDLAVMAKEHGVRIVLAGGLTAGNVADAVRQVSPFGVDVSSGVESTPGKKDPGRMREFVAAARAAVPRAE